MPAFSIIVPVYNVEDYVSLCLYSLRNQTFEDIEIICVDDGSTDGSADVVRKHAACDNRIQLISKPNGGLSSARNVGIRSAAGKYLLFVDSDDFLVENACEKLNEIFAESSADVVTFGANPTPKSASNYWTDKCLSPEDAVYNGFSTALLFDDASRPYVWRTALRRLFVEQNSLFFNENVGFGEDQVIYFDLYALSSKTVLSSLKLYNYRLSRSGSLMATVSGERGKKVHEHLNIVEAILASWSKRGLMGLCPSELLDWILEFLFEDIFKLPETERDSAFCKLGLLLAKYFGDLSFVRRDYGLYAKKVIEGLVACGNGAKPYAAIGRDYTLFRIGWAGYAHNIFLRLKECVVSAAPPDPNEVAKRESDIRKCEDEAHLSRCKIESEYMDHCGSNGSRG